MNATAEGARMKQAAAEPAADTNASAAQSDAPRAQQAYGRPRYGVPQGAPQVTAYGRLCDMVHQGHPQAQQLYGRQPFRLPGQPQFKRSPGQPVGEGRPLASSLDAIASQFGATRTACVQSVQNGCRC